MDCYSSSSKCIYWYIYPLISPSQRWLAMDSSFAMNVARFVIHNCSGFLLSACGWELERGPYMVWIINLKDVQIAKPFIMVITHNKVPSQFSISIFLACGFLPLLHRGSANGEEEYNPHSVGAAQILCYLNMARGLGWERRVKPTCFLKDKGPLRGVSVHL